MLQGLKPECPVPGGRLLPFAISLFWFHADLIKNAPLGSYLLYMAKLTQEMVDRAAVEIWESGQVVTYSAIRERLHCRKSELVPYMQQICNDPRQKRKACKEIGQALDLLRQAIAAEQRELWSDQVAEIVGENGELSVKLAATEAALESAEARIAELTTELATAKAETEVTRSTARAQTGPLLEVVSTVISQQRERAEIADLKLRLAQLEAARPTTPEITPCTKWTAL